MAEGGEVLTPLQTMGVCQESILLQVYALYFEEFLSKKIKSVESDVFHESIHLYHGDVLRPFHFLAKVSKQIYAQYSRAM